VNKGQITIWIIVIIVILIAVSVGLFLITGDRDIGELLQIDNQETTAVKNFVEQCIKTESSSAIRAIAAQGGFLLPIREAIDVQGILVPVFYQDKTNLAVTRLEMGEQLAAYMNARLIECANFSVFEQRATQVIAGDPITTATISDQRITFDVTFPLTISKDNSQQKIRKFVNTLDTPLGDMQKVSAILVNDLVENGEGIDLVFLSQFPYNISVAPYNKTHLVYGLLEFDSPAPLYFQFATKHEEQRAPYFQAPDKFTIIDEEAFFFDFEATDPNGGEEGKELIFTDDRVEFEILSDGKLVFVPEITGLFNATITVTDPEGFTYSKVILFKVVEDNNLQKNN